MNNPFNRKKIEQVPARQWESWVAAHQGVILDVREPSEWAVGTLSGAVRISMGDLQQRWASLDSNAATLVVCRSGNRSNSVAKALADAGFHRVANMAGGMAALGLA